MKRTSWSAGLLVTGDGTGVVAHAITQAHQLVGAVLKYAKKTGKLAKNVALEMSRSEDLPTPTERERRYLTHAELLRLARPPSDSRR